MSADDLSRGETITEGWRAPGLFTDRYEAIRLFASYLNDDPSRDRIVFFHGDGGNGKSLLMKVLQEQYCKRVETADWKVLQKLDDGVFCDGLKNCERCRPVPSILIDFGLAPRDVDRPQDKYYAPLIIRRELAASGLKFPLFDFAHVWYLHKKRRLSKVRLKELFPDEEISFLITIADAISGHPVGAIAKAIFNLFGKHLGNRYLLYKQSRGLDEGDVEAIRRMDPDKELIDYLPALLALDLNAAMEQADAPPRLALLFDTHEAFWGEERNLPADIHSERDEWLRRLLATLDMTGGIVAVVAGREPPRWDEPSRAVIPRSRLDLQLIGHLSDAHAAEFLARAQGAAGHDRDDGQALADPALRQELIELARVAPDQVHPYYLGLGVDMVLAAFTKGEALTPAMLSDDAGKDKNELIVRRLLRYVDEGVADAVGSLAAARAFTEEIYHELGAALKFDTSAASFRALIRFSFVWKASGRGDGWYRIHDLLRRLFRDDGNPVTSKAHAVLEEYFRIGASAGGASIAEAIYHANRREPERSCMEWRERFEHARRNARYGLCRALLEVRSELAIPNALEQGLLSQCEGDYYAALALHAAAQTEYVEAVEAFERSLHIAHGDARIYNNLGVAHWRLGDLQSGLTRHGDAEARYAAAMTAFDRALQIAPDAAAIHNNRGNVLRRLGDLQLLLARHEEAEASYAAGVASFGRALHLAPGLSEAHTNQGDTLANLADLQSRLSRHEEAEANYADAVEAHDRALRIVQDDADIYNSRGVTLQNLGYLLSGLGRHDEAELSYVAAVEACDRALRIAPDHIMVHNNRGNALRSLGDLRSGLGRHKDAEASYDAAIAACDRALKVAPDHAGAQNNRGMALQSLGGLQSRLSRHEDAEASHAAAIAAFDRALQIAPDDAEIHNNRGMALRSVGNLQSILGRHGEAEESYTAAVAAHDRALLVAPDYALAHNNRGIAQWSLGDLRSELSRHGEAEASYEAAIASYDRALHIAPDFAAAYNNRGGAMERLGDLQSRMGRHAVAEVSYASAIAAYDRVIGIAPGDVGAHNNRGSALARLGDLQSRLGRHVGAEVSYAAAIAAYDRVIGIAPELAAAHNNRGGALANLAHLQQELGRHGEAEASYASAIDAFDCVLRIAPDDITAHIHRGSTLASLAIHRTRVSRRDEAEEAYAGAIAAFDRVLGIASDHVPALQKKASLLAFRGSDAYRSDRPNEARKFLQQALDGYSRVLEITPANTMIEGLTQALEESIDVIDEEANESRPEHP